MFGYSSAKEAAEEEQDDEEYAEHQHQQQQQQQPHIRKFYRDDSFNPQKVDDLLRNEMMELSVNDRNGIYEEIHGVRCMAPLETPEFLERSLFELNAELARIPPLEKRAFCHASAMAQINTMAQNNINNQNSNTNTNNSDKKTKYVDTDEFRLRFLRCELFDVRKAARRLVNYLDLIAYCLPFQNGMLVLQRPITMSDLSDAEQSLLRKGHLQLLPFRDRSGRRVLTGVASLGIRFDPQMWYKIVLYLLVIAGDDVESQQKGIIFLIWPNPDIAKSLKLRYPINSGGRLVQMVLQCAPIRIAACHFCTPPNDPFYRIIHSVLALCMDGTRSRLKFHSGEPIELEYKINSYGIPVDLLPRTSTGNVKTTYLKQWIRQRSAFEEDILANNNHTTTTTSTNAAAAASATSATAGMDNKNYYYDMIECPGSSDVVFRQGKQVMNHPGNVAFRSLIESKSSLHETATQTQKSAIAKEVVDTMIEVRGGRFLVWDEKPCCWKAITDHNKQRHKVAIAFRNFKSYRKAMGNRQTIIQSTTIAQATTAMSIAFENLGGLDLKKRKRGCLGGCDSLSGTDNNE